MMSELAMMTISRKSSTRPVEMLYLLLTIRPIMSVPPLLPPTLIMMEMPNPEITPPTMAPISFPLSTPTAWMNSAGMSSGMIRKQMEMTATA